MRDAIINVSKDDAIFSCEHNVYISYGWLKSIIEIITIVINYKPMFTYAYR